MGLTNKRKVNIPQLWRIELKVQYIEDVFQYSFKNYDERELSKIIDSYELVNGEVIITEFKNNKEIK